MTALQWIVKEAKSLKKSYPKRFTKWTDYVKQASAIYSSKHGGKSPVGKKKAVKKVAVKKTAKKIGYSKTRLKQEKGITKALKQQPRTLFPYTDEEKIIHAGKKYFDERVKQSSHKAITGTKKKVLHSPLKKKAVKKPISTHKDTKSHNVNIKVVSGINNHVLDIYKRGLNSVEIYKRGIEEFKHKLLNEKNIKEKAILRKGIKLQKTILKELIIHNRELKKRI